MERTKKEGKQHFHNTGRGTHRLIISGAKDRKGRVRTRMIKPNEKFWAYPHEIPEAFRDVIKPIGVNLKEEEVETIQRTTPPKFKTKSKGGGWYDVVDGEGNVMNNESLRKEDAENLKARLEKEGE